MKQGIILEDELYLKRKTFILNRNGKKLKV